MSNLDVERLVMTLRVRVEDDPDASVEHSDFPELLRELSASELVVVRDPSEPDTMWIRSDGEVTFGSVFTSLSMLEDPGVLKSFGASVPYALARGHELGRGWPEGLFLAINPGIDGLDMWLDAPAVARLGHKSHLEAGTEVVVGASPRQLDPHVVEAVQSALAVNPAFGAAVFFELHAEGHEPLEMLGLVEADPDRPGAELGGDPESFVEELTKDGDVGGLALTVLTGDMLESALRFGTRIDP